MKSFLNRYSLLLLDLSTKLFFIYFTYMTTLYLSKDDFNQLSYYRTTLMMMVGLTATGIGYYILNFFDKFKENKLDFIKLNSTVLLVFIFASILIFISLLFFNEKLHLNYILETVNIWILYFIILVAIIFQLSIYYIKVLNNFLSISKIYITFVLIFFVLSVLLIKFYLLNGAIIGLLLFYSVLGGVLLITVANKIKQLYAGNGLLFTFNIFDINFKKFLIPNILESFLSVPRTWLSIFIFIQLLSFSGVGDLLLLQMILGMFIFFIQSLLLNDYNLIKEEFLLETINKLRIKINIFIMILLLSINIFWTFFLNFLNITELSNEFIFILYIGTILQSQLMLVGIVFKKMNYSQLTFYHNLFYAICFLSLEYILIVNYGIIGYSIAFLLAWVGTYIYMFYHLKKYDILIFNRLILDSLVFIALGSIFFYIRFF